MSFGRAEVVDCMIELNIQKLIIAGI